MADALPDPDLQPEFYEYVAFKRAIAFVIDSVLILILTLVAVVLTAFVGAFVFPALFLAIGLAYRIVTISWWSATPGMRIMAIEFRTLSGFRLDQGQAFLHSLAFTGMLMVVILLLVSIVLMLISPRGQGLGDHLLGTTALNRPSPW